MTDTWCLAGRVPRDSLALFETALEELGGAMVTDAVTADGTIPVSIFLGEPPLDSWKALLSAAANAAGVAVPDFTLEAVPARDWVAESYARLPAIRAGRFYVHGSHIETPPPAGTLAIAIDAATAFGTGHHETTQGCLLALDALAKARRFRRPLDMGCGSGILAVGMAHLWNRPVMAVDVDHDSVRMAAENAWRNGVPGLLRPVAGQGFADARVRQAGPYDLIVANILAGPLCDMAGDMAAALLPGGTVVLSGLLRDQEVQVRSRYRIYGLKLTRRVPLGEWITLVLQG